MAYVNVYPSRINWENDPSINTPINASNLNKMDYALYSMDGTLAGWDTTKADQSDLLLCVKTITYDTDTGEFVFTWQNGNTYTVDLNIEKIPVSFSMDANGVITMVTDDGTSYTADVGSLIKTYTFTDSSEIDFTVTTDASGNKTVTASIVAGSIDGTKLVPNYLADCQSARTAAGNSATSANSSAEDAEAWAVGERDGVPVPSTDPTYHNNSKYWSTQAPTAYLSGLNDVNISTPVNGDLLVYNSSSTKWENGSAAASKVSYNNVSSGLTATTAQAAIDELDTGVDTLVKATGSTTLLVDTSNWTQDTTSQSGTTLYKKAVSISHVYADNPVVSIGCASGSVLPTAAQQADYDLVQYATVDSSTLKIYLYASAIPSASFYIEVTSVD